MSTTPSTTTTAPPPAGAPKRPYVSGWHQAGGMDARCRGQYGDTVCTHPFHDEPDPKQEVARLPLPAQRTDLAALTKALSDAYGQPLHLATDTTHLVVTKVVKR